jgi:hypothetical protein
MATTDQREDVLGWLGAALWLLPLSTLLLALTTLTHEPDHAEDFAAWSEYVTTGIFRLSHVAGSILGAALGLVGVVAALIFLVHGSRARSAFLGTALTVVANIFYSSVFGIAAFTQPAMGLAFLAGEGDMRGFYDDVYGGPMLVTFAVGSLAWLAGAGLLGLAVAGTAPELRWAGRGYAAAMVLFPVLGFSVWALQPVAGLVAAVSATVIALRLPHSAWASSTERGVRRARV